MRRITATIVSLVLINCNQPDSVSKIETSHADTSIPGKTTLTTVKDSAIIKIDTKREIDTALYLSVSEDILKAVKEKNYKRFSSFIHPHSGIRFSPYAYIDTLHDKVLSSGQFLQLLNQNKQINWNSSFESETNPENLTIPEYFEKFVYDVDFLKSDSISINQYHSQGTDLNNINLIYPEHTTVEFFFPGFEKKYDGLDFRGLRLVFRVKNNIPYLTGIIHDQWTP